MKEILVAWSTPQFANQFAAPLLSQKLCLINVLDLVHFKKLLKLISIYGGGGIYSLKSKY